MAIRRADEAGRSASGTRADWPCWAVAAVLLVPVLGRSIKDEVIGWPFWALYLVIGTNNRYPAAIVLTVAIASFVIVGVPAAIAVTVRARRRVGPSRGGALLRVAAAITDSTSWLTALGTTAAGFVLDYDHTVLAVAVAAALAALARLARGRMGDETIALVTLFTLVLGPRQLPNWSVTCLGGAALVLAMSVVERSTMLTSVRLTGPILACGMFASSLAGALGFVGSELERVIGPTAIYDLAVDPSGARLYFTTTQKTPPGYLDLASHTLHFHRGTPVGKYERMALFPDLDRIYVGGSEGVREFRASDLAYLRGVVNAWTADVERAGPRLLASATDGKSDVHVVDLERNSETIHQVPEGSYGIEADVVRGLLFATSWETEPVVSRIDLRTGEVRSARIGYENLGLCAFPSRRELVVARPAYGSIAVLDEDSLAVKRQLHTVVLVRELACDDPMGLVMYAQKFGRLFVADVETGAVLFSTAAGSSVRTVRYDSSRHRLFLGGSAGVYSLDLFDVL